MATTSTGGSGQETSDTSGHEQHEQHERAAAKGAEAAAVNPGSAVIDISGDPVIEAAEKQPAAAPAAQLHALDEQHLQKVKASQRARLIKAAILAGIGVLFIVFVLQNAKSVDVNLIFATISVPLIWVIVIPTLLGAAACYLIVRPDSDLHFHLPERRGAKAAKNSEA